MKIKPIGLEREIFNKIVNGKARIDNPYAKPLMELWEVEGLLIKNKKKVPKILNDLIEEIHKLNLNWKPF